MCNKIHKRTEVITQKHHVLFLFLVIIMNFIFRHEYIQPTLTRVLYRVPLSYFPPIIPVHIIFTKHVLCIDCKSLSCQYNIYLLPLVVAMFVEKMWESADVYVSYLFWVKHTWQMLSRRWFVCCEFSSLIIIERKCSYYGNPSL